MKPLLVSFPRAGRTWLMEMVGLTICCRDGLDYTLANVKRREVLDATHQHSDKSKKIHYGNLPKPNPTGKVILLLRDPRDIVVSAHLHAKHRKGLFKGSLAEYLRDPRFGIKKVIRFYNNWRGAPVYALWYEELKQDPVNNLTKILKFCEIPITSSRHDNDCVVEAVGLASLENLQEWERTGYLKMNQGKPKSSNTDGYYHRKGEIGDYKNHFSARDIAYANEALEEFEWQIPTS